MTLDWFDVGLKVGTLILSVGAMLVAWIRTRRVDVDRRFEKVVDNLVDFDRRVQRLEDGRAALPTKEEVNALLIQLTALHGKLDVLSTRMDGQSEILTRLDRVTTRHEDHLLQTNGAR
ncbi:MAG TPA: DUF2730 family protein [Paracoccaceae bacterium]|nr:DUF2730 family protein [Paracoccaceae bacterium]